MSMKLKALGLALVAAMAVGAFGAANASATGSGHFVSEADHTILQISQLTEYSTRFSHGETEVECKEAELHGTIMTKTVTSVDLTPTFSGCRLAALPGVAVTVTHNECKFRATIRTKATSHNPAHLVCPVGSPGIIQHWSIFPFGSCTVTFKPQPAAGGGIAFHTGGAPGNTHDILATVTLRQFRATYQQTGLGCAGTNGEVVGGGLDGNFTLRGFDTIGNQVGITATGSED